VVSRTSSRGAEPVARATPPNGERPRAQVAATGRQSVTVTLSTPTSIGRHGQPCISGTTSKKLDATGISVQAATIVVEP